MLEMLNDKEVLEDYVLGKIIRYNHRRKLQDESVASHSFYVSLFCLKIMAKLNLDKHIERQTLILAALHDTAESMTSDIPHDVKIRYPDMQSMLNAIEREYYHDRWPTYERELTNPNDIARVIVDLADAYSVYQYCLNETTLGNMSSEIFEIRDNSVDRINALTMKLNTLLEKYEF